MFSVFNCIYGIPRNPNLLTEISLGPLTFSAKHTNSIFHLSVTSLILAPGRPPKHITDDGRNHN